MTRTDFSSGQSLLCVAVAVAVSWSGFGLSADDSPPTYAQHFDLMYYLDASAHQHRIESIADWDVRRKHILQHMQSVMGSLPARRDRKPPKTRTLEETRVQSLLRRKIEYRTDSTGSTVRAWLFLPVLSPDSQTPRRKKRPAILCLHQTTKIGKDEPAGLGGNPHLHYALELARRGYVTLAPDYPSLGESTYDFDSKHGYQSGTMKAVWDNVRAIDLLQSLPAVDPKRIGCIGHSLGGHNAMFTAVFEPRIRVIVSSCGFSSFQKDDVASWSGPRYMPLIAKRFHSDAKQVPFDFTEVVGCLAPRPFLACAPLHDSDFDVSGVRDCLAAARPVYKLYGKPLNLAARFPDAPHDFPDETRTDAYEFLDRHLKHP